MLQNYIIFVYKAWFKDLLSGYKMNQKRGKKRRYHTKVCSTSTYIEHAVKPWRSVNMSQYTELTINRLSVTIMPQHFRT